AGSQWVGLGLSRMVGAAVSGGSVVFTLFGGAGIGWHRRVSRTNLPRSVGDVRTSWEKSVLKLAWPRKPPRFCPGATGTFENPLPEGGLIPYSIARSGFTKV